MRTISLRSAQSLRDQTAAQIAQFTSAPVTVNIETPNYNSSTKQTTISLTKKTIQPAKKIPFLKSAYQLDVDRKTIRKSSTLNAFHEWLKVVTEGGIITRQETVSMVSMGWGNTRTFSIHARTPLTQTLTHSFNRSHLRCFALSRTTPSWTCALLRAAKRPNCWRWSRPR